MEDVAGDFEFKAIGVGTTFTQSSTRAGSGDCIRADWHGRRAWASTERDWIGGGWLVKLWDIWFGDHGPRLEATRVVKMPSGTTRAEARETAARLAGAVVNPSGSMAGAA